MSDAGIAAQERAVALMRVRRHAEAAKLLRDLLADQPEHAGVLLQLARCHRILGQLAEAMRLVDRALGFAAAQQHLLVEKARILLAAGHPAHAAAAAQQALERAPRTWEAHGLLAEALLALGNPNRVVAARRHADTALELAPQVPDVHLLDARLHARMGRLRAARAACRQALALDPTYEPALSQLALLDAGQDRAGRAARGFSDALAADPQAGWSSESLAAVSLALCWRLFDVVALAAVAHWVLFAAVGGTGRPVRLVAALLVLVAAAAWALRSWRRQPTAVRWQLRRHLNATSAVVCQLLTLVTAAGLVCGGLAPRTDSPAGAVGALLLLPGAVILAVRLWRQLKRRAAPTIRRLGYAIWTRLAARATTSAPAPPR
ncbi:tetratricopeptide repeat protein [Micromonospora sp. WMMD812]|uniref:tetratricopeptide repeat protein n=1 Tax=Micromonospora sp. WMMD812 TaxID=3015152 RepID=UPI00248BC315|nr:tetratricopeptide repeat protein [Micromonospora sp. WMMD812]WBB65083.1 tetratricopeptide repeat protein [Micromonospora sp. WMMD812]